MIKVAVFGAAGRMGRNLIEAVTLHPQCELGAAIEVNGHSLLGQDAGVLCGLSENQVTLKTLDAINPDDFDVAIDFTIPEATMLHAKYAASVEKALVIGTTGLTDDQKSMLSTYAESTSIVFAPNMSVGVNVCLKLLKLAAEILGEESDIEVIEAHHRNKIDAPSGTALKMGEVVAETLGRTLKDCAVYGREGRTGVRDPKTIGFETIRAGDIVGDHTVMFASEGEIVEITHRATNRKNFAQGAVKAAVWLAGRESGLYNMQDVLGLS